MGQRYAIIIGIERLLDETLPSIPYAEQDAKGLVSILSEVGFESSKIISLIGSSATKTTIESRIRKLAKTVTSEDRVLVFYSGLGFTSAGASYLACYDTQFTDLEPTSIALSDLWTLLHTNNSTVCWFIDAGFNEVADLAEGIAFELDYQEIGSLFEDRPSSIGMFASKAGQASHAANSLNHRIWGYHLIEAFSGRIKAKKVEPILRSSTLWDYLKTEVPRTARKVLTEPAKQTPVGFGAVNQDIELADLKARLAQVSTKRENDLQQLKRVVFRAESTGRVKDLSGYQKGYRLPEVVNASANKFVARIASEDIKTDIEDTFNALREHLGFKRKDLEASAEKDGMGFIRTPAFDYSVHVSLNDNDPTVILWRREVSHIQDPEMICSPGFQSIFGTNFDTLIFEFATPLNIEELVDEFEDEPIPGAKIRTSIDASSCDITLDGFVGMIRLESDCLKISGRSSSASSLIDQFFEFQRRFGKKRLALK